jgi:hypothetical protein
LLLIHYRRDETPGHSKAQRLWLSLSASNGTPHH